MGSIQGFALGHSGSFNSRQGIGQWVDGREIPEVKVTLQQVSLKPYVEKSISVTETRTMNQRIMPIETGIDGSQSWRNLVPTPPSASMGQTGCVRPIIALEPRLGIQVTLELIHESQVLIFSNSHPYGPRGPEVRGVDSAKNLDKSSQKPEESYE